MGNLIVTPAFTEDEKNIFAKAFPVICDYLKITGFNFSALLDKEFTPDRRMEGSSAWVAQKRLALIYLNSNQFTLGDMIAVFGHEMTHTRQHLMGYLKEEDTGGITWRGSYYPPHIVESETHYGYVPWEREAHGNMGKVYRAALAGLPKADRIKVEATTSARMLHRMAHNERSILGK